MLRVLLECISFIIVYGVLSLGLYFGYHYSKTKDLNFQNKKVLKTTGKYVTTMLCLVIFFSYLIYMIVSIATFNYLTYSKSLIWLLVVIPLALGAFIIYGVVLGKKVSKIFFRNYYEEITSTKINIGIYFVLFILFALHIGLLVVKLI